MDVAKTLEQLDSYLKERNLELKGTVIGGAGVILSGYLKRETDDIDMLRPGPRPEIIEAAAQFADATRGTLHLQPEWLNNGHPDYPDKLNKGWELRTKTVFTGQAIQLNSIGRMDLIKTKLRAYVEPYPTDEKDLIALNPNQQELAQAENGSNNPISLGKKKNLFPNNVCS